MSVSSATSRIVYTGNNSLVTAYAVPFYFEENAHLNAIAKTAAGVETVVTLTNVTGAGDPNGGTVRTAVAVPATSTLTIYREVPFTQTTSYAENDAFPAESHEKALDKLTTITQQLERRITNCIRGTEATPLSPLPSPTGTQQFVLTASANQPPSWQEQSAVAVGPIIATGSTQARFISDRFADTVNVKDFGAVGDGVTDDYGAFLAAVNSLSAEGGQVMIPSAHYVLGTTLSWGNKSVFWNISPGCVFSGSGTGAGKFPYMDTNTAQLAVGPFIQSKTSQKSTHPNGGVAAFQVEMIQPSDYGAGQSVAVYAGARGSCPDPAANVWAINALIAADAGAEGVYQCLEVDVDCASATALMKGIAISGGGTSNPDVGIEITRLAGVWNRGLHILNAQDAILIAPVANGRGIVIGSPSGLINTAFSAAQSLNGADTVFLQRATDAAPSGYFFRAVNAVNSANLFLMDVAGNFTASGLITANNFRTASPALPAAANTLSIGAGVSTTASSGTNGAVPAQVAAYLEIYHGANKYRVPMFN